MAGRRKPEAKEPPAPGGSEHPHLGLGTEHSLLIGNTSVGNSSGTAEGSSTIWQKINARAAASGRRARHRCNVLGCPWRMLFFRADAALIASSGMATSISFLRRLTGWEVMG